MTEFRAVTLSSITFSTGSARDKSTSLTVEVAVGVVISVDSLVALILVTVVASEEVLDASVDFTNSLDAVKIAFAVSEVLRGPNAVLLCNVIGTVMAAKLIPNSGVVAVNLVAATGTEYKGTVPLDIASKVGIDGLGAIGLGLQGVDLVMDDECFLDEFISVSVAD